MDFLTPHAPGDRLGSYTLLRKLGEGGMGVVFEAQHDNPERATAAVKVLTSWLTTKVGRARFEREIEACASLAHPNTVEIYEHGETPDGSLFYAMEYLDGWDLKQLVDLDGAQSSARTIRIVSQIAGALHQAHERGLVHRDIKPPNILLCGAEGVPDRAKLVDFGLVSPLAPSPTGRLTREGLVIGTPRYVPPEMLRANGRLSPATDFYALGLVAYFLLSARHAFDGASAAEILRKQRSSAPIALTALVPDLSSDLASVVDWCLEKEPSKRPQNGRALQTALRECYDADRWDSASAEEWWDAWRERPRDEVSSPARPASVWPWQSAEGTSTSKL